MRGRVPGVTRAGVCGRFPPSALGSCRAIHPRCRTSSLSPQTATVLGTRELDRPDWPPGSVIYTGPNEPNLRVVDVLDTENDDPERFKVLVVEAA
jgi:hypothetical protein